MARIRSYSAKQIRRTMRKYVLASQEFRVAPGIDVRVVAVDDAYTLFDRMVEQEARQLRRPERYPYWAEVWPAAVALAQWFAMADSAPAPARALELGCGLGLVGVALARLGWQVEATDYVEDALVLTAHNAHLNQVSMGLSVGYLDWNHPTGATAPYVVASDVLYDPANHAPLVRALHRLLEPSGWFYTSDPRRAPAQRFVGLLTDRGYEHAVHCVRLQWRGGEHTVDIHAFGKPAAPAARGRC